MARGSDNNNRHRWNDDNHDSENHTNDRHQYRLLLLDGDDDNKDAAATTETRQRSKRTATTITTTKKMTKVHSKTCTSSPSFSSSHNTIQLLACWMLLLLLCSVPFDNSASLLSTSSSSMSIVVAVSAFAATTTHPSTTATTTARTASQKSPLLSSSTPSSFSPSSLPSSTTASSRRGRGRGRRSQRGTRVLFALRANNGEGNNGENDGANDSANGVSSSTSQASGESTSTSSSSSSSWDSITKQFDLFRDMALIYYKESNEGRWMLATVLGFTLLNSGVSVMFSYLSRDFWNALSSSQPDQFAFVLQKYVGALCLGAPIITYYRYQREQLSVHWREWMTARTFNLYVQNRVYYNLAIMQQQQDDDEEVEELEVDVGKDKDLNGVTTSSSSSSSSSKANRYTLIDNPDQRIQEDVNSFTQYSLQLVITLITSVIDLCSFATILWSIYPALFGAIIGYAIFGTVVTAWLGQSLVQLNFQQLSMEASFRYALVRLRDNAESIAFYKGEDLEGQMIERRLEDVMSNKRQINVSQRNLEFFTTSYRYLVQILPVAVIAPKFFAKQIELGVISQAVGAFNHILNDLSIIVNQFESLSTFSAGIERLSSFYEEMRRVDLQRNETQGLLHGVMPTIAAVGMDNPKKIETMEDTNGIADDARAMEKNGVVSSHDGSNTLAQPSLSSMDMGHINRIEMMYLNRMDPLVLSIDGLDLSTPDGQRTLIHDLHIQLRENEDLLIVGNSGAGKSSLLRAIAGLWTTGNGTISRPNDDEVYFLPQRPYCTVGTLKDQLLYPSLDHTYEEEQKGVDGTLNGIKHSTRVSLPSKDNRIVPRAHWLQETLTDADLVRVLEQVTLLDVAVRAGNGDPVKGLYRKLDWSSILSLGEQQRLAFGRVLVNRPRLVILDEATSALDMEAEARMYGLLKGMATAGADITSGGGKGPLTYISVGHRPSLLKYHDKRLRLSGEAGFELSDIDAEAVTTALTSEIRNL